MKYHFFLALLIATFSFSSYAAEAESNSDITTEEATFNTATDKKLKKPAIAEETTTSTENASSDNTKKQPTPEEEEEPECE